MRRLFVAGAVIALVVAASPIGYYLIEQGEQRAIEFVRHYKGVHGKGASISDFVSLTDLGCSCSSAGQISQSWQAEPTGQPNVWRVTIKVKTALRTRELTFYTDMVTVWAGDQEAERIIEQVNALQYSIPVPNLYSKGRIEAWVICDQSEPRERLDRSRKFESIISITEPHSSSSEHGIALL